VNAMHALSTRGRGGSQGIICAVPSPSWELKLARAEQHFAELQAEIARWSSTNPYTVTRVEQIGRRRTPWYVSLLSIDPPPTDWVAPMILGDVLFNLRSALDHIASALDPKHRATFPITPHDISGPEQGLTDAQRDARRQFREKVRGLPPEAVAVIERAQAHHAVKAVGGDPNDYALVMLNRLQNVDKHARLLVVGTGLRNATRSINSLDSPQNIEVLGDGAEIFRSPTKVAVGIRGDLVVGVARPPDQLDDIAAVPTILRVIRTKVIRPLEPFL